MHGVDAVEDGHAEARRPREAVDGAGDRPPLLDGVGLVHDVEHAPDVVLLDGPPQLRPVDQVRPRRLVGDHFERDLRHLPDSSLRASSAPGGQRRGRRRRRALCSACSPHGGTPRSRGGRRRRARAPPRGARRAATRLPVRPALHPILRPSARSPRRPRSGSAQVPRLRRARLRSNRPRATSPRRSGPLGPRPARRRKPAPSGRRTRRPKLRRGRRGAGGVRAWDRFRTRWMESVGAANGEGGSPIGREASSPTGAPPGETTASTPSTECVPRAVVQAVKVRAAREAWRAYSAGWKRAAVRLAASLDGTWSPASIVSSTGTATRGPGPR